MTIKTALKLFLTTCAISSAGSFAIAAPSNVNFAVTMSEAVNVTGCPANCPRIAVTVDGQTRYAEYSAGTGTSSLTFSYAPTIGDLDLDGVTLTSPIDLNGGTITDLNGNAISPLTYTVPNTSGIKIDYPSLSMDFTNGANGRYTLNGTAYTNLTSFLGATGGTFARASIGTYHDSSGYIQSAASGQPRLDYDPLTHIAKGILIEESRTNSLKYSQDIDNATWVKNNMTVAANQITAPDNLTTAEKIIEDLATAIHSIQYNIGLGAGTTRTISLYAKAGERIWLRIFASDAGANSAYANYNLSTGSTDYIGGGGGYTSSATIENIGHGWYRCTLTYSLTTGTTRILFLPRTTGGTSSSSYAGNGTSGLYIWGAQIEDGAFATSYIPTAATAITRASDDLAIPVGSWFNAATGTLKIEAFNSMDSTLSAYGALRTDAANRISITRTNVNDIEYQIRTGNVSQAQQTLSTGNGNNAYDRAALGYKANDARASVNGTLSTLDTSSSIPPIVDLSLGNWGGSTYLNGNIQKLEYYPSRVTDTQIQLLTQ